MSLDYILTSLPGPFAWVSILKGSIAADKINGLVTNLTLHNTGLHILDADASHDLIIKPGSDLTADRTLTITTGDADRTVTIEADSSINQDVTTDASPTHPTIKLTNLTESYVPYHSTDSAGLIDSPAYIYPNRLDFLAFTETDGPSKVTVTSDTITLALGDRDEDYYATWDLGAGAITNFTHWVDVNVTALTNNANSRMYPWGIANSSDDFKDSDDLGESWIIVSMGRITDDTHYNINIIQCNAGTLSAKDTSSDIVVNTPSYLAISRSGSSVTVQIYSTSALRQAGGAGDIDTITGTAMITTAFQYIYGLGSYNSGVTGQDISGTVSNLIIDPTTKFIHTTSEVLSSLTASKPVFTDGTKKLVSSSNSITLSGDLTVESAAIVDQDYSSDATPTHVGMNLGTGELTAGSINRAADTLTLEIGGTAELSIAAGVITVKDGGKLKTDKVEAYDSAGLSLLEDGGLGIFVEDTTGYVGIGTTAPQTRVEYRQDHDATVGATNTLSRFGLLLTNRQGDAGGYFTGIAFDVGTEVDSDSIGAAIYAQRASSADADSTLHDTNLLFATNDAGDDANTVRLTIAHDGDVGIGTMIPKSKLDISGTIPEITLTNDVVGSWDFGDIYGQLSFYSGDDDYYAPGVGAYIRASHVRLGTGHAASDMGLEFGVNAGDWSNPPSTVMIIADGGRVGIGTTSPNQLLTVENSMSLKEIAAANADTAAYGQIWVANSTPNELWFTDDAGTDTQLSSHPMDAPASLYTYGPGIDWIGKRIQKFLGIIFWQQIDGTVTEETFEAYNARRKDEPGHVDLVKKDVAEFISEQKEKWKENWIRENTVEIEVPVNEITESYEVDKIVEQDIVVVDKDGKESIKTEPVIESVQTIISYAVDEETGAVKAVEETKPIYKTEKVIKYRMKKGTRLDEKTGKVYKTNVPTAEVAEAAAITGFEDGIPQWIKSRLKTK